MVEEKVISITMPELLVSGIGFAESPLWHKDGFLIFSDVRNNRIMKLSNGKLEVFLNDSGWQGPATPDQSDQVGANGIAYDKEGYLIFCQHGKHAVARLRKNNEVETIIDRYQNKRLNSPNDLCVGADGSIYFTDPPYGLKDQKIQPRIAQPVAGVYRSFDHMVKLLTAEFKYPNGICFSPDYKHLYIGSAHPEEKVIRRYEVIGGRLYNGMTFLDENTDGLKTDQEGNLYLASQKSIKVFSKSGKPIAYIPLPEEATNLCLHNRDLYITTRSSIYRSTITMPK